MSKTKRVSSPQFSTPDFQNFAELVEQNLLVLKLSLQNKITTGDFSFCLPLVSTENMFNWKENFERTV